MPIPVTCRACDHKFSAPDGRAGKTVACAACDDIVLVPKVQKLAATVRFPTRLAAALLSGLVVAGFCAVTVALRPRDEVRIAISTIRPEPSVPRTMPDGPMLDRIVRATVYIELEGGGTGTGWFGLEPNVIVTNAHVIGMKKPGSPEPRKLRVYLNPGEAGIQRKFEGPNVRILAVDHDMDLALLEIIREPNLPSPLPIRPSGELRRLDSLLVFGFPGGRRIAEKNRSDDPPAATVAETKVQVLRKDARGQLYAVQIQGGLVHGNSGGPICDRDGAVVAVASRVDLDEQGRMTGIAFGIPMEAVRGLIDGRIGHAEYGPAFYKDGKVHIPVAVACVDPRRQLRAIGVACWVGNAVDLLAERPGDTSIREVKLLYDPANRVATGELIFPAPEAGKAYFGQPYFSNATTVKRRLAATSIPLVGPPYERLGTDLTARVKLGSQRLIALTCTADLRQFDNGAAEPDRSTYLEQTLHLTENLAMPTDPADAARVEFRFDSLATALKRGTKNNPAPRNVTEFLKPGFEPITASGIVSKSGVVRQMTVRAEGDTDPLLTRLALHRGRDLLEALEAGSVALPNKEMRPGETWAATRPLRFGFDTADTAQTKEFACREDLRYTYLGLREGGGRREAVVLVEGGIAPSVGAFNGAVGTVRGFVYLESETGVIVESEIRRQFEIDSSVKGPRKQLTGSIEFKLVRGINAN